MKLSLFALLLGANMLQAQDSDLSYRVRQETLDQRVPVTVSVSTKSDTTLQFPAPIQSLEGDGFTTKPGDEAGDFSISPGVNWVSIRSLRLGAAQNLGVVLAGKIYEVMIQTAVQNDFSVIFQFGRGVPRQTRASKQVWSPIKREAKVQ